MPKEDVCLYQVDHLNYIYYVNRHQEASREPPLIEFGHTLSIPEVEKASLLSHDPNSEGADLEKLTILEKYD